MLSEKLNILINDELTLRKLNDIEFKLSIDCIGEEQNMSDQSRMNLISKKINEIEESNND